MKLKSLLLFALVALLAFARPARADDVSFDFFYDALSPYGEWLEVGDYGYCWRPNDVDDDWAPYSDGYWSYTDAGWTWVSYEDFGGIVYHYGRWARVEDEGWVWVPDYEWGPAWVSWRQSDDYVGWAPLPAEARWERDRGFSVWVDTSYDIGPSYYNFCRVHDFGAPVLRPLIIRRAENLAIIGGTVNITNISFNSGAGCAFNGGLDYGWVSRFSRRPIPALKLVRNTNISVVNNQIISNNVRVQNFNAIQRGNQLNVLAPNVVRPPQARLTELVKPRVRKFVPPGRVNKGWNSVPEDQREGLRAKFARQTEGRTPDNAPARGVRPADLKVVPSKADPTAKLPGQRTPSVVRDRSDDDLRKLPPARPRATPPLGVPGRPAQPSTLANEPKQPGKTPTAPRPGNNGRPKMLETPDVENSKVTPAREVRPGVIRPFNPADGPNRAPAGAQDAAREAAERQRKAAAAAAATQPRKEAPRPRSEDNNQRKPQPLQPQVPARPQPGRDDAAREAATRQRMAEQQQQQQRNQREAAARLQAQQQAQQAREAAQARQAQQAAQARNAQATAARERATQAQAQQAQAARREAAERAAQARRQMPPQAQQPRPQQARPQQARPQQAVPQGGQQPARNGRGKRPLTPEEAQKNR